MFSWTFSCIMNAAVTMALIYCQKKKSSFKIHSVRSGELAPSSQPLLRKYSSKAIMWTRCEKTRKILFSTLWSI